MLAPVVTRYRRTSPSLLHPATNALLSAHVLHEGDEAAVGETTHLDRSESDLFVRTHSEGECTMAARPHGRSGTDLQKLKKGVQPTAATLSKLSQITDLSKEAAAAAGGSGQNGELKITLQRSAEGFGFTIRTIRVYLGEHSTRYRLQHLVATVDHEGPAFLAGIRAGYLITEVLYSKLSSFFLSLSQFLINNAVQMNNIDLQIGEEKIDGWLHTEVIRAICMARNSMSLTLVPLESSGLRPLRGGHRRSGLEARLVRTGKRVHIYTYFLLL